MYNNISDNYKTACKALSRQSRTKVVIDDVTYNGTKYIKDYPKFSHSNEKMIGGFPIKSVEFSLWIKDGNIEVVDKEIKVYRGLIINNEVEWILQGSFYAEASDVETSDTGEYIKIKAYDSAKRLGMIIHQDNNKYPISEEDFIRDAALQAGLEIDENYFPKTNYILTQRPNMPTNTNLRTIFSRYAEHRGAIALISRENKIQIKKPKEIEFSYKFYEYKSFTFEDIFGPIDQVALGKENESDNITYPEGENFSFVWNINNNPFLDLVRFDRNKEVFDQVKGLEIIPFSLTNVLDVFFLDINDVISIQKKDGTYLKVTILSIETENRLRCKLGAKVQNNSDIDYKLAGSIKDDLNEIRFDVDYNKNQIQGVVKTTDEHSEKIADLEINIDEISTRVDTVIDVDEEKETGKANLNFVNINNGTPIFIQIHPIDEEIGDGYPTPYKTPRPKLTPKSHSILRFHNITENEDTDYIIPTQLRVFNNVYDELYINYVKKEAYVAKRIEVNEQGRLYVLDDEEIVDIPLPTISLKNGDYKVSLLGYENAFLRVSLMIQNIYTTQFPTKDFMGSLIKQLRDSILLEVREGYIDKDDILAQINLAIEEGKGIIKFLADTLLIDTDNFKLDEIGKLECIGAILKDVIINGGYINFTKNNDKYGYKTYVNYQQINLSDDFGRMIQFYIPDPDEFMTGYKQAFMKIHDDMGQINISTSAIEARSSVTNQNTRFNLLDGAMYLNEVHANNFVSTSNGYIPNSPDITKFTMIYSSKYYLEVTSMMGAFGLDAWLSDKRLKKDINDTKLNALDIIDKIKHREFKYKVGDTDLIKIGYVADELQEIDEQMIFEIGEDKIKQPSQSYIIPLLSKGIQELHKKVVNQNKKIASLEERINKLESLIKGE